ncbi:TPA: hypothetical protein ACGUZP_004452, partial [Vibrio vulnificus]
KNQWFIISLFPQLVGFEFVGKLALVGAVFLTFILWRWKFERCLNPFSGKHEVRAIGSIRNVILGFSVLSAKVQSLIVKIMGHFSFLVFGFCL